MATVLFIKNLIFAVIVLFLFTGFSSVYAGSIFNEIVTLEDENVETVETALDKIRKVTDGGLPIGSYKQSKMVTMDKIVSRESLLNRYDSSEKLFRNPYNRIRQPTLI